MAQNRPKRVSEGAQPGTAVPQLRTVRAHLPMKHYRPALGFPWRDPGPLLARGFGTFVPNAAINGPKPGQTGSKQARNGPTTPPKGPGFFLSQNIFDRLGARNRLRWGSRAVCGSDDLVHPPPPTRPVTSYAHVWAVLRGGNQEAVATTCPCQGQTMAPLGPDFQLVSLAKKNTCLAVSRNFFVYVSQQLADIQAIVRGCALKPHMFTLER